MEGEEIKVEVNSVEQQEHKRRVRYSGKYPKKFSEKYKELNPEKYGDEVAHVLAKGNTPAGTHIPIMVKEINEILHIQPGEVGVDCTLGYGGHTRSFLDALQGQGHLYSCDIDTIEYPKTIVRLRAAGYGDELWTPVQMNFSDIDILAQEVGGFDFVLADLGVSSMQIDNPERGFTYKADGPLDLRMNPESGVPAYTRLQELTKGELIDLLVDNSDEPYAEEIASQIVASLRRGVAIDTTRALYKEVEQALLKVNMSKLERKEALRKSAARVFQALRIDVNGEFDSLLSLMQKLPGVLKPGGRVAILTFHSGEDRIVKKAFKEFWKAGIYSQVVRDVIRASKEECYANSRAKPAKLRWAVK